MLRGVATKTAKKGRDGYTFGYTARPVFCGACSLLESGSNTDSRAVYDDEGVGQFVLCHLTDQPPQCLLGFFNRRRPNSKAHNAMVALCRKGTAIGEVFIEGHDDGGLLLCPHEDLFISLPRQSHIAGVEDGPRRL